MGFFAFYNCIGISAIGSIFLLFIAILFFIDYEFITFTPGKKDKKGTLSKPDQGLTCIYASGIYISIILSLILYRSFNLRYKKQNWDQLNTSSDDESDIFKSFKVKKR